MTILFLARLFYPHIGGVEKHVMEVGKRLIKKGHKVIVIAESTKNHHKFSSGKKCDEFIINDIKVYSLPLYTEGWIKKFKIWLHIWKLRKTIINADIIHCHDVFFWYLPFRFLYPRKPVYTTFHGYESYPISKKAIIIRKISEKLSFGNICIGDFIKKWYSTKPDYVSYGAVETPNTLTRTSYILNHKSYIHSALFYGRLDEQTGILTYNDAFKILKKKYPKFVFLVIGDGPDKSLLDKKAKAIGFQKNPEQYFQNYRFAFVSRYLSILEAMSVRRLVFAVYDNPVKEDYLKMAPFTKFIIIENDPKRLAYQVEKIINNPDIEQEMIKNAYEWVRKQTWEEMINIYISLWRRN